MTIAFKCEHCGKEVKAPDEAAGKRGKCPFCGESNYVPAAVSEEDVIPLAPIDEAEERRREEEIRSLMEQEKEVIAEMGAPPEVPLEHRENLTPEDLYHFVVNYCLDLLDSKLDRANTHLAKLKQFPGMARQAAEDFRTGKASEPIIERIPKRVLNGFLKKLCDELK